MYWPGLNPSYVSLAGISHFPPLVFPVTVATSNRPPSYNSPFKPPRQQEEGVPWAILYYNSPGMYPKKL